MKNKITNLEPNLKLYDAHRITVLGEYGEIGLPVAVHIMNFFMVSKINKEVINTINN